jgi:hypothetical protein
MVDVGNVFLTDGVDEQGRCRWGDVKGKMRLYIEPCLILLMSRVNRVKVSK